MVGFCTLPSKKNNEVTQLNEAFADWFASQVVGGTNYFALTGYVIPASDPAARLYKASATPNWSNGMEANVGHRSGPVFTDSTAMTDNIARFATLFHDAIDGLPSQRGSELTTDTYVWSDSVRFTPIDSAWNSTP